MYYDMEYEDLISLLHMSMEAREVSFRLSRRLDLKEFKWLNTLELPITSIQKPVQGELYPAGNFPHGIMDIFWCHPSRGVKDHWRLLVRLDNYYFAFFRSITDRERFSSDFDPYNNPDDGMDFYVSPSYADLVKHVLTDKEYEMYRLESIPYPDYKLQYLVAS